MAYSIHQDKPKRKEDFYRFKTIGIKGESQGDLSVASTNPKYAKVKAKNWVKWVNTDIFSETGKPRSYPNPVKSVEYLGKEVYSEDGKKDMRLEK